MEKPAITVTKTVQMHETDAAGVMHFSNYYRWMEYAEGELFDQLNIEIFNFDPSDFRGWPRFSSECTYRVPIFFRERAEIEIYIQKITHKMLELKALFFKFVDGQRIKAAEGLMRIVYAKKDTQTGAIRAALIPEDIHSKLSSFLPETTEA